MPLDLRVTAVLQQRHRQVAHQLTPPQAVTVAMAQAGLHLALTVMLLPRMLARTIAIAPSSLAHRCGMTSSTSLPAKPPLHLALLAVPAVLVGHLAALDAPVHPSVSELRRQTHQEVPLEAMALQVEAAVLVKQTQPLLQQRLLLRHCRCLSIRHLRWQ